MDSEGTETSRRNDSVGQDIRAGFGFFWILRAILDRAALLILTTLQNDPSCLEKDKPMRVPPSSVEHSIIQHLVTGASIYRQIPVTNFMCKSEDIKPLSKRYFKFDEELLSPSVRRAERTTTSGSSGDGSMINSSPSVDTVIEDLVTCLHTVQDVLSSMETQVAGPIFCYQPILEQQDGNLLMIAMGIERNLDMLEYHQVKKDENTSIRIFNHLKHLLQSILPVLSTTFEEYLVSMNLKRATSVLQRPGGLTAPIMPNLDNIRSQLATASPSVEMQNQSGMEETIEMQLVEKGQDGIYLVPFLLSNEAEDFVVPIQNIYNNARVKQHFDARMLVNLSGGSTMISSKVSVTSCINELMNAHVINSDNHLPPVHSHEFINWIENLFSVCGGSRKAHDQKMKDLEEVIQCGLAGKKFLLILHGISEDQMAQWEYLFRAIKSGSKGSKIIVSTRSANVEKSVRNVNILQSDEVENNVSWRFFRNFAFDSFNIDEVVSAKWFRRVESNYLPASSRLMTHMSVTSGFLPTLRKFRWRITELHLRTLIVFGPSEHTEPSTEDILDEILRSQKYIRALDLTGCGMQKLPELSNESRHHLRYLSLQDTGIGTLENFDKFYHLLVFNIRGCQLRSLPDHTSQKLLRVRHIIGPASLVSSIHHIGNLKNLQELQEFRVGKRPGHGIEELQDMNLRKSLSITNLENVISATKAGEVNLSLKTCLVSLRLEWHSAEETSQSMSTVVLEQLQPPNSLNELEINGYPGFVFPTWFTEDHLINVKKVTLRNCSFVSVIAPLAKFPSLEELILERFSMLERISESEESDRTSYFKYPFRFLGFPAETSCRFPRLVKLRIEDMTVLEEWTEQQPCFPCLEELTVRNCPKLAVLPPLHHARVNRMHIEGLPLISFNSSRMGSVVPFGAFLDVPNRCPNRVEARALQPSRVFILRHCPNLSTFTITADNSSSSHGFGPLLQLEITDCKKLKSIQGAFAFVEKLYIEKCHSSLKLHNGNAMKSLHTLHIDSVATHMDPFLLGLRALRILIIKDSEELNSLDVLLESDHLPDTLEQLQLINCNSIKSLPWNMDRVLVLESLQLINCPNMQFLPCLPNNLTELRISGCPILKEKYGEYGPEWDNISHVPYVSFD
uniref:Leucine Rich Repeat family protein, expressed n=1 Tax=Oryza sativa subsp. japonica TaxID=39947 RepID=Q2R4B0_ORYSJ|nr:Leucine Rich Repeat family protein, expressed [Oryza sativa Japonica Group]